MNTQLESFLDELEKIAYGSEPSPRGGFLLASHGNVSIPLRTKTPAPPPGVPMAGYEKDADFDATWGPGDFKPVNINKKKVATASTPAGAARAASTLGKAPGAFLRKGTTISKSRPIGMGHALPLSTRL